MANNLYEMIQQGNREKLRTQFDAIYDRVVKAETERDEANEKLRSYNKDKQVAKLLEENAKLKAREYETFCITPEEQPLIDDWKKTHLQEKHNGDTYTGAIGGRYTYTFTPTSIGTIGYIRCCCGEEFCFKEP